MDALELLLVIHTGLDVEEQDFLLRAQGCPNYHVLYWRMDQRRKRVMEEQQTLHNSRRWQTFHRIAAEMLR